MQKFKENLNLDTFFGSQKHHFSCIRTFKINTRLIDIHEFTQRDHLKICDAYLLFINWKLFFTNQHLSQKNNFNLKTSRISQQ